MLKSEISISRTIGHLSIDVDAVATVITDAQLNSGEIPWCKGQKTDPWDHVEAAMGLSIAGYLSEAQRAFEWFAGIQREDGSCYSSYRYGVPEDKTRETNFAAYIAVGIFHYYLITMDVDFLRKMWPTVSAAIDFALGLQTPEGEIYWAISPEGNVDPMALVTGCSSIFMSIKCALAVATVLGYKRPLWLRALERLRCAIASKPYLFNMTKSRYAMDWFYPILSGVVTGAEAQRRIDKFWKKFVVHDRGVKCVFDQPWVTIAETAELALTLSAMGHQELAKIVFGWMSDRRYEDGSFWCGFTCPDLIIWPEDKITWTNAGALMAADAIYNLTPAGQIFYHRFWESVDFSS